MYDHLDLERMRDRSLRLQEWIRRETFAPEVSKVLRRFSLWEVAEFVLGMSSADLRSALAENPDLPRGEGRPGVPPRFTLEEVDALRRRLRPDLAASSPFRPAGGRGVRVAVANFKGGAGKTTVALHFAHAAALAGNRVLLVDFDPQATLSHSMGVIDVAEDRTVWGVMARDLALETARLNAEASVAAATGRRAPAREVPAMIRELGLAERAPAEFVRATAWPTIDIVPSCANAAFVEFASAQYRHLNPDWSFYGCVSRFLAALPRDAYDLVLFDCPPAIGYQTLNAVYAADMLYVPSGPAYWEYDSTTSFIGQIADALADLAADVPTFPTGKVGASKAFVDVRFLLTRYEPGNELHAAMFEAFRKVFGDRVCTHPVEQTRAVEQAGRFLCSVYEMDYRDVTRETWKRARRSFDRVYEEFAEHVSRCWSGDTAGVDREEPAA